MPETCNIIDIKPPVVFIGDLHLGASEKAQMLLSSFFDALPANITIIGIGDIVDYWAECRDFDFGSDFPDLEKFQRFQSYFIKGNRDFLIGERWEKRTGGVVLGDEAVFNVAGRRIKCVHGDTLVQKDWRYQLWRKFARSGVFEICAGALGESRSRRLAGNLKTQSKKEVGRKKISDMQLEIESVEAALEGNDILVCGHTHKPERSTLSKGELIVLGPWDTSSEVLFVSEAGNIVFRSAEGFVYR
ncbi:MAG: metallophosphoesterase family protein [Candidatus Lindowbacteria bacterium]|nr:metallophosphoesterase family protein [Candidatus Lindowbacteria bacterium]